ncbi:MAG TPA: ABC transporter permease subunit [Geminicoccaceae bacterium]
MTSRIGAVEAVTAPQEAPRPRPALLVRATRGGPLAGLFRAYGDLMAGVILVIGAVWVLGLITLPQVFMLEQSLWHERRGGEQVQLTLEIDNAYQDLELLRFDRMALEGDQSAEAEAERERIQARMAELEQRIAELEAAERQPVRTYGLANYARMSGLHFQIFLKTLVAGALVTLIALVVCYPMAYVVAKVATPQRAALLMLGLVIPYAINELLRIFAWLMILDFNGVLNTMLGWLGLAPVRYLDSSAGVFVGMVYAYVLFMVFPIYNTVETLDRNQIEAARDLGASTFKIHSRIVIPHAKPGIAVGCIMTFMLAVGSYSVPQILSRGSAGDWFSQLIYKQFFESFNWNTGSAYAFTLLLTCIAFIFVMMAIFRVGIRDIAR